MAGASDYLENKLLDHILRNSAFTQPSALYVSLHTGDPKDDDTGANELAGGGYARQSATFNAANNGAASNTADLTFAALDGVSATPITHFGIYDHATAGNLLITGTLNAPKTVPNGEDAVFRAGNLTITLD